LIDNNQNGGEATVSKRRRVQRKMSGAKKNGAERFFADQNPKAKKRARKKDTGSKKNIGGRVLDMPPC